MVCNLKEIIDKKLEENHQTALFYDIELPLAKILGLVEINGFKVNEDKLKEVGEYFNASMKKMEKEIFDLVGYSFNVASPKQLGVVLFEDLQLGHGKKIRLAIPHLLKY